ncbi:hypothetical protein [Shimia abyssi]|uniref:Uncharacterized protein n=1 Tax=Shimia abyssi TaxID=1662395 RepID=A0A2P8FDM2_9RHOB|nr:hypothetical protein [Shimia abyssi]PSL19822.1 hypothetical protein CLV88_105247 [Shimia abyssi]
MKTLSALGSVAGGFLMNTPPKSVLLTLFWIGGRSHPALTTLATVVVLSAWLSARQIA